VTAHERKRDAYEKIQLGSLVVKAGLRDVDKAVLLGALRALARLDPKSGEYNRLKEEGRAEFERDTSN